MKDVYRGLVAYGIRSVYGRAQPGVTCVVFTLAHMVPRVPPSQKHTHLQTYLSKGNLLCKPTNELNWVPVMEKDMFYKILYELLNPDHIKSFLGIVNGGLRFLIFNMRDNNIIFLCRISFAYYNNDNYVELYLNCASIVPTEYL